MTSLFIQTYTHIWASLVAQLVKKKSAYNAGDLSSIPGLGRSPGKGKGYPLQYSGLENSMDYVVHWVAKSRTRLSLSLTNHRVRASQSGAHLSFRRQVAVAY